MTHLIDKDKLIDEFWQIVADEEESIRTFERQKNQSELQRCNARIGLLNHILSLLNTLEVKEVDSIDAFIDKAWDYISRHQLEYNDYDDFKSHMKGK